MNGILFNHESAAPRRDVRHAQDHARRGAHQARPRQEALPRQPRRQARLGLRRRLRRGDVADAPAGQARRLRDRHRRDALACASSSTSRSARSASTGSSTSRSTRATSGPTEVDLLRGDATKARAKLGWKPKVTFRELVEMMVAPTKKTCARRWRAARPARDGLESGCGRVFGANGTAGARRWASGCPCRMAGGGGGGSRGVRHHGRAARCARWSNPRSPTSSSTQPRTPTSIAPKASRPIADAINAAGAANVARARPRPRERPSSTTRPTSCSTASSNDPTTRAIRRRRRGATRHRKWPVTRAWRRRPSAIHPARRLPIRAGRPQLSVDDRAPPARRRDHPRRTTTGWDRRPGCARSPTYRRRSAAAPTVGLYHCTAHGETTWADFATWRRDILGVPAERVEGVSTAEMPLKAPRPRRAILDNRRLREHGLDSLSSWQDALRAFIAQETG